MFTLTTRTLGPLITLLLGTGLAPGAEAQVKAALTRDIDRSSAQPVNAVCYSFSNLGSGSGKCTLYKVPAGKRLVVETVAYDITLDAPRVLYQLSFGTDPFPGTNSIQFFTANLFPLAPVQVSTSHYTGTQPLKIYLDENQQLAVEFIVQAGGADYRQSFFFSGYLVDK